MAEVNITVNGKDNTAPALGGINAMEKATEGLKFAMEALGVTISAMALFELGKEAALEAAKYESLGVTMEVLGNTAGYTRVQMEGFEETLAKAGVVGSDARQNLALMAENHVDLAHSAELSTIAQNASAVAGISVSEAFQRVAFSIDTGNARTLRAMGITVNYTKAYQDYAREIGKSSTELSEYEKVEARVQMLLKKGPDIEGAHAAALETTTGQIKEMKKGWLELLEGAGAAAQPILLEIIGGISERLKGLNEWFKENKKTVVDWGYGFESGLINVEAEIIRMGMLLDKVGGTKTTLDALGSSIGSALGISKAKNPILAAMLGSKEEYDAAVQANQKYEQLYNEKDKMLQDLGKKADDLEARRNTAMGSSADEGAQAARIAKGQATRDDEKATADAEVAEKRYMENVKHSIENINDYTKAAKELGKERLELSKSDYTDKLTREFDLYKEGKKTIEDLTVTVRKYGVEVNDVFNQRMANEKEGLDKLGTLYQTFQANIKIYSEDKEAKTGRVEILKAYRDTAQGIIATEKDRYKTLLAGEEEYTKKILANIQEKQKELDKLRQSYADFNKVLEEQKRLASGDYSGGYQYLDPNLDALAKRSALTEKLRNDEAAALAITDQAMRETKLQEVIKGWAGLGDQVDLVTTKTKTYADLTKGFSSTGFIPETTETITSIDTVITKEKALTDSQVEQKRIYEAMIGTRQTDIDKETAEYNQRKKVMDMYRDKLLDLDTILKNLTRTITIDLKVNGMEQIDKMQGFVGAATQSPFASPSSSSYSEINGRYVWGDGTDAGPVEGRASGGDLQPHATYQINEDGTEFLTMGDKGGWMTPAGQAPPGAQNNGSSSTGITIQGGITFSLPNVTNQTTAKELARMVMPELQQLQQRYRKVGA